MPAKAHYNKNEHMFNHFRLMAEESSETSQGLIDQVIGKKVMKACELFDDLAIMNKEQILHEIKSRNMLIHRMKHSPYGHILRIILHDFGNDIAQIIERIYSTNLTYFTKSNLKPHKSNEYIR